MSSMQAFYRRIASPNQGDGYLRMLRLLAQASLSQVLAVANSLAWDIWHSDAN